MAEAAIARAFEAACGDELLALKPGNVHVFSSGHGMDVEDFRAAAAAAAPHVAQRGAPVGARIRAAVAASFAATGQNTNLGIVLLCAPLALAAESRRPVAAILAELDVADAQGAFDAIAMAAPAGLGEQPDDVRAPAGITLLAAMRAAAGRDLVARQYVENYADVFSLGLPALRRLRAKKWPEPWPAAGLYMTFLAAFPDTHIARKYGLPAAERVRGEAAVLAAGFLAASDPAAFHAPLLAFDAKLKAARENPGACADLTVATLFADRLGLAPRAIM